LRSWRHAGSHHLGLPWTFGAFAALNLAGALLVYLNVSPRWRASNALRHQGFQCATVEVAISLVMFVVAPY
jgi:hypothetical protein